MSAPTGSPTVHSAAAPEVDRIAVGLALLLLVDFVLAVVMLATDKNLQTDFGALSSGYYAHWYGVLVLALVDLVAALVVLGYSMPSMRPRMPSLLRRYTPLGALAWPILAILAMVGIVESYQEVGFMTANQFSTYLFGTSDYPGVLSYIPWLYDLMLALFVLTAIVAALAVWQSRHAAPV
ncbi:MAG: hypothetical protein L3K16_01480 [Thermoplasmata archaeon]|nr:hypothetical protein [Thermoplasmata archaeon]